MAAFCDERAAERAELEGKPETRKLFGLVDAEV